MHVIYYYRDFMEIDFPFKLVFRQEDNLNEQWHAHEHFQICYVIRGQCLHHVNQMTYPMSEGDLLSIPPFEPHCFSRQGREEVSIVQVDFMPIVIGSSELLHKQPFIPCIRVSEDNRVRITQMIYNMRDEMAARESGYEELIRADLIRLLVTIFRESNRSGDAQPSPDAAADRRLFREAAGYIDEHYTEPLQLNSIAKLAAMSPTYFSYMFKVLKGQTFVQYVNGLRIKRALDLLRLTDKSVYEIAFESGFNNISHFNRTFKRETGMSPNQYRMRSR